MDIGFVIALIIIPVLFPLVNLAVTRDHFGVKKRKSLRIFYSVAGGITSLLFLICILRDTIETNGEPVFALFINIITYIACYKIVVSQKFRILLSDYDDVDHYLKDLAESYGVKYPLTENTILLFGDLPKLENHKDTADWIYALKSYFKKVKSL